MGKNAVFYASRVWRKLRKVKLLNNPICEECKKAYATEVHHLIPLEDNYDLRLSYDNLQSLCKPCHSIETRKEMQKKGITPGLKKKEYKPGKILNKRYAFK